MAQVEHTNREVERFLLLLKSEKGKTAGEFLSHNNVAALKSSSECKWYYALDLFAYGTYSFGSLELQIRHLFMPLYLTKYPFKCNQSCEIWGRIVI